MLSDARARSLVVGSIALLSVTIVLLALVTLSTPLIKPIAFVTAAGQQSVLGISSASASLSLGLWGACLRTSATATACSKPALGFHNRASSSAAVFKCAQLPAQSTLAPCRAPASSPARSTRRPLTCSSFIRSVSQAPTRNIC